MPYGRLIAATVVTLGVCQGHLSIASFSILTSALRGPSATAELLVNFWGPSISHGWLKRSQILYKGAYIKSCQRDEKSPLEGAWFCSRDPFLYAKLWS